MRDGFLAGLRTQLASDLSVVSANLGVEAGFGESHRVLRWGTIGGGVTAPPRSTLYSPGNSLMFKPVRRSSVLIISHGGMVRLHGLHKQSVIQDLGFDAHIGDFLGVDLKHSPGLSR